MVVVRGAGLYPWTLGSRHEWSCAVLLGEGSEGSERKWVCLLIALEQAPPLEQGCCNKPQSLVGSHYRPGSHQNAHTYVHNYNPFYRYTDKWSFKAVYLSDLFDFQ